MTDIKLGETGGPGGELRVAELTVDLGRIGPPERQSSLYSLHLLFSVSREFPITFQWTASISC